MLFLLLALGCETSNDPLCTFSGTFEGRWSEVTQVAGGCSEVIGGDYKVAASQDEDVFHSYNAGFVLPGDIFLGVGETYEDLSVTGDFFEYDDRGEELMLHTWNGDCLANFTVAEREDTSSPTWDPEDRRLSGTLTCDTLTLSPTSDATEDLRLVGAASFELMGEEF